MERFPAGAHGRGFPPFQRDTFESQLMWLVLSLIALYLVMSGIALHAHRLDTGGGGRQRIDGDLAEARTPQGGIGRRSATAYEKIAGGGARARPELAKRETASGGPQRPQAARKALARSLMSTSPKREDHRENKDGGDGECAWDIATETAAKIIDRLIGAAPRPTLRRRRRPTLLKR